MLLRKRFLIPACLFIIVLLTYLYLLSLQTTARILPVGRGEFNGAITLDQNWSQATRATMNQISFGSRLLPYRWFLHLEQADSEQLFRDTEHIRQLGFIPQEKSPGNPDALPVGFAPDDNGEEVWIGLSCTACHTGQLSYQGQRLHIDGAPAMMDFQRFETSLYAAISELLINEEKFTRFASALGSDNSKILRDAVQERQAFLEFRLQVNRTESNYGYGRLDAFGQIFNAIAAEALKLPDNRIEPDAPVNFPVLWDASHHDLVQWNGSMPNTEPGPILQNASTALAVYGQINILQNQTGLAYHSSTQTKNLGNIQANYYQLSSPLWPEDILGSIDQAKAQQGEQLYQQHCLQCHALIDRNDPNRKVTATLIPLENIATDPQMSSNFFKARVKTGPLEGKKLLAGVLGEKMEAEVPAYKLVLHAASSALLKQPWQTLKSVFKEKQKVDSANPALDRMVYKARPLNGIWASAPYLHNGSVPTVYDLLLPAEQRPLEFISGSTEIDPVKLGLDTRVPSANQSLFDTRLKGNHRSGHEFGSGLIETERMALIEYLKTL